MQASLGLAFTVAHRSWHKYVLVFGIGLTSGLRTSHVAACGGGGIASHDGLVVNAQRVVISSRHSGTTDVVAQINVPTTTSNYGVLIPVPSEPTLDEQPVSADELDQLDRATAPEIQVKQEQSDGSLLGCGSKSMGGDLGRGVTVIAPVEIGPVVAVSLKADTAAAINTWLLENDFSLPDGDSDVLERYVASGHYFIAIKRSENATDGSPSSIGIHYSLAGDHRMLSLAFARIGAASELAFTLFVVNKTTTGPSAPFTALTLDDLEGDVLKHSYTDAIRNAVEDHDSKAFVLESSTPVSTLVPLLPKLSALFDDDSLVTRATTLIAREKLTTDAVFGTPFTQKLPSTRTVSSLAVKPRAAGLGSFSVVTGCAIGLALRRRKR